MLCKFHVNMLLFYYFNLESRDFEGVNCATDKKASKILTTEELKLYIYRMVLILAMMIQNVKKLFHLPLKT